MCVGGGGANFHHGQFTVAISGSRLQFHVKGQEDLIEVARLNSTPCDTSMAEFGPEHGPGHMELCTLELCTLWYLQFEHWFVVARFSLAFKYSNNLV